MSWISLTRFCSGKTWRFLTSLFLISSYRMETQGFLHSAPLWSSQDLNLHGKNMLNAARYPPIVVSNKPLGRVQFAAALQTDTWKDPTVGDQKISSRVSEDSHSHINLPGSWQRSVFSPGFCLVPQPPSPGWSTPHCSASASSVS